MCRASATYCPSCGGHWQQVAEAEESTYTRQQQPTPWRAAQGQRWQSPRRRADPSPRRKGRGKGKKSGEAPQGKGNQVQSQAEVPDTSQLPAPPKVPKPNLPKPPEAPTTGAPTEDRRLLEQLMEQLAGSATELPPSLATMVSQFHADNHRMQGKQLHQLVAKQTQAKREIARLEQEGLAFEKAWTSYMTKLTKLVEEQMAGRKQCIEEREEALGAWKTQLADATMQLAASTGSQRHTSSEMEIEEAEAAVNQSIEDEQAQQREREQASERLQAMLLMLQSSAPAPRKEREGSRTPRRKKQQEAETVSSASEAELEVGPPSGPVDGQQACSQEAAKLAAAKVAATGQAARPEKVPQ